MHNIKLPLIVLTVVCGLALAKSVLAADALAQAVGGFFTMLPLYLLTFGLFGYIMRRTGRIPPLEWLKGIPKWQAGNDKGCWKPDWGRKISWPAISGAIAVVTHLLTDQTTSSLIAAGAVCLVTATHLAAYAVLYGIGRAVRNASAGRLIAQVDRREIVAIWAVTIGILALVIAISDPGTQTRALAVSPIVLLTCWLRHIDVIRTGIPLVALSGGGGIFRWSCRCHRIN